MHAHQYEGRPNATLNHQSILLVGEFLIEPPRKVYARLIHKSPKQIRRPHNGYTSKHKASQPLKMIAPEPSGVLAANQAEDGPHGEVDGVHHGPVHQIERIGYRGPVLHERGRQDFL